VRRREPGFDITGPDTPINSLCRFEFLEVIVRLSTEKYRGTGLTKNFSESVEKLIEECIKPNYTPGE
jgi:hypothetical protein